MGLNMNASKWLCLGELIVFQLIKNENTFWPLLQIYEEIFSESTHSRDTSVSLQQHIMLVPKPITFLTQ